MENLNVWTGTGRLTRDIEVKQIGSSQVAKFGLASNYFKGNNEEGTLYLDVELWGKQAEIISKHLSKGSPVLLRGELRLDNWTDKENNKRSKIWLRAEKFWFMDGPKKSESSDTTPDVSEPVHSTMTAPDVPF